MGLLRCYYVISIVRGKSSSTYIAYFKKNYINIAEKLMNQFSIGCMVNPTLNFSKVFREQFDKCLKYFFSQVPCMV